jgi:hypothetical protein
MLKKYYVLELERQRKSILIVCHIAVLRCIYAYFMGVPLEEIPFKEFKHHHLYELEPGIILKLLISLIIQILISTYFIGAFGCTCSIVEPHLSLADTNNYTAEVIRNNMKV